MDRDLHLPASWEAALLRGATAKRLVVLGPTDVGKSSFIGAMAERRPGLFLADLDPGQKMLGAPGTAALGRPGAAAIPDRFVFLGSSAVGSFRILATAAAELVVAAAPGAAVVNTPGYVAGPGARLQAMILSAVRPDLIVAIGAKPPLEAMLARFPALETIRIEPSPFARRKSSAQRRAVRQASFAAALAGADRWSLARERVRFEPGSPRPPAGTARPVCALADEGGEAMEIAILVAAEPHQVTLFSRRPVRPSARIQLGRMWAEPGDSGWTLLEPLASSRDEEA